MDIRTLLVCHLALLALNASVLLVIRLAQRDLPGTGWLAGSCAAVMVGTGLGAARGEVPDAWSIVAGNACIMLGYLLLHRAVTEFLGLGRRHLAAGLAISAGLLAGVGYLTYVREDTQLRIVVVSAAFAAQVGLTASLLLRSDGQDGTRAAERFLGAVLAALAALNALRGALTLAYGAPEDFLRGDALQTTSALAFILVGTAAVFGFIWMVGARIHTALHREANLDPLTGLLNRRGFLHVASARIRALGQEQGCVLILFADLDGLKRINDTAGHDAGDRAIAEAADVMREVLRASDSIARLGGDEFCALIPVNDPGDSAIILRRLEERVEAHNARPGRDFSIGISAAALPVDPAEGRSLEELLREADRGMYAAKHARRRDAADAAD